MIVLGLDPGLATFGLALVSDAGVVADVMTTEPIPGAGTADDRNRRTQALWRWIWARIAVGQRPQLIAVEAFAAAQGAKAIAGLSIGATLASLVSYELGVPLAYASPSAWRSHFGSVIARHPRGATKAERAASRASRDDLLYRAVRQTDRGGLLEAQLAERKIPEGKRSHARDAYGIAIWARNNTAACARAAAGPPVRSLRGVDALLNPGRVAR